ncbi:alpha-mannosidase [Enterococcus sp. MJM12]|uniref:Alpha-mannosidase n=1 Tax=Candidatus Enterococcus myersii TaxID=2815322 RepID=A0ABS3H4L9_9ENTE|nr:alpha-mannosidase [Enterococcus sp. MJM12]
MSLFYLKEKLAARIEELEKYRFSKIAELSEWLVLEDETKVAKYPPKDFSKAVSFTVGDTWQGRDFYLWVKKEIEMPDVDNLYLYLNFGHTGGGYNSGFESLMFINGKPYQGVDSNHKEVKIADEFRGKKVEVALKLWSGLEGGGPEQIQIHEFKQADICQMVVPVDELFYYADAINKTVKELGQDNPIQYKLSHVLNQAINRIDWVKPGSPAFYTSVVEAVTQLSEEIAEIPKDEMITVTAVGHTHIDVAWLWRLKHTREKAARSFSTVLRLMEEYPEYIFLQTQPQLYKYIKEDYPEIYAKIKDRVAEGRWEADGSMWLEADCNIPSGESLTRQILHGAKFIREEFNQDIHYLWLPDVFGYSWALPQILKKSGIDTFMTTKISWNQFNRMPHDTFKWKGMDGSEVLTHFITTPEPGEENSWESNWYYTYNGELEPETVLGVYNAYRDKNINDELLISYGFGDGGGGVNRDMLEKRRKLDQIPGLPKVQTGKAVDYFNRLQETFENTDEYVHTWDGELYLEYHRGTYTSQAYVKKANRQGELFLRQLEILFSLMEMKGQEAYPKDDIFNMWEIVLRNQFHDIIPGSSIKEVYEDHRIEMEGLFKEAKSLLAPFQGIDERQSICNFSNWKRSILTELPVLLDNQIYIDEDGNEIKTYSTDGLQYALIENVPALGKKTVSISEKKKVKNVLAASSNYSDQIENDYYLIKWNESGQLTSIFDKELKREVLSGTGNVLQLFEDKPMNFDAWDIDIYYQEKFQELAAQNIVVKPVNALYQSVEFTYYFGESTITQEMRLYPHTRRIDFVTDIDWQERQQLLKTKFDVSVRATYATYDIQYGNVRRANNWNTSWEMAKFETVAHQWMDLSQRDFGVSILNDSKYGCDVKGQRMRLSLLKSAIHPDPTADMGKHHFTYSLYPHRGDFIEGKTIQEAWEINEKALVLQGDAGNLPQIVITADANIVIDAIKKAEDDKGWIIRAHEYAGTDQVVDMAIEGMNWWCETDLLERNLIEVQDNEISLTFAPFEIKTIRFGK